MVKVNRKIIISLMIIITMFSCFQNIVLAKNIGDSSRLVKIGDCNSNIEFKFSSGWSDVICHYIGYNEGGKTYPAYCISHGLDGVDEHGSYSVDLTKILDDVRIYRVIINGYPYKSPSELGVADKYDAYLATKQAIYSVLLGRDVTSVYRGKNSNGNAVVNAINNLTNIGRYGNQTYKTANLRINKSGGLIEEGDYFSQRFNVSSAVDVSGYDITSTNNLPTDSYITDSNGNRKTSFNNTEDFKLMIPKSSMDRDINSSISIKGRCKTYPVFYGQTTVSGTQNYAVTAEPYVDYNASIDYAEKLNTGKIRIIKQDSETKQAVQGVTFSLSKSDGTVIANSTTNEDGIATFSSLYRGKYILKEVSTNEKYILNESEFDADVEYNKTTKTTILNEHKRGDLKVYKVDKDNNKITLGNVEFQLYSDEFKKVIGTYYTDVNGEIEIKDLRIGDYKLIETNTNRWYNLSDDRELTIEWNKETSETIENELKKGQIKIIKVDLEDHKVKLEGVTFEVLDENNNVLETLVTDENGEALTSKYAVRDFPNLKLRETNTLEEYVLNKEIKTIKLEENQITNIVFENKKIKGYIEVIKISSGDNKLTGETKGSPLSNVTFEVFDSSNNKVDEITTNSEGKAITKELLKGKYTVKEKEKSEYYLLNTDVYNAEIVNDGEIIDIEIENIPENPDVDIEKTGIIQTTANEEIKYDFKIRNTGNVPLNNFTWFDNLPTDYVRITKLITGTYNQELNYSIYYKTNKNDYKLLKDNLNTSVNNYMDFTEIELQDDEYVTDFKADFGTVNVGFESVINPYIFVKVNSNVKNEDTFTNKTRIEGSHKGFLVWDEDDHTTKLYEKNINIKNRKLPRTGM